MGTGRPSRRSSKVGDETDDAAIKNAKIGDRKAEMILCAEIMARADIAA
jgi:hypothetical protein